MTGPPSQDLVLRAPFPWFGGKSRVAGEVWARFGEVPNYVEPFYGSGAVLLARPSQPKVETVNDLDCYLANFWRALQADPKGLADHADWPVNEADLHARHLWLVNQATFRERMKTDPTFYDLRVAGWWVWGVSQWIGGGWCSNPEWRGRSDRGHPRGIHTVDHRQRPSLGVGQGINKATTPHDRDRADGTPRRSRPNLSDSGKGVHAKRPDIARRGMKGVHRATVPQKRPRLGGKNNTGVHRSSVWRQLPDISGSRGAAGRGVHGAQRARLYEWFDLLAARLRTVRICCGDWMRVLGPSPTVHIGMTGVFLDPPYSAEAGRDGFIYSAEDLEVAHAVRQWAIANGDNPKLRIALCGYEGEHEMPSSWSKHAWKSQGGYGCQGDGRGKENRHRERIWFSPYCITPAHEGPLFARRS